MPLLGSQPTGDINPAIGCHCLLPDPQLPSQLLDIATLTPVLLYCLVTEARSCEYYCTAVLSQDLNTQSRVTTLETEKIPDFSRTFPDEIADNISNKCTPINTKSACYELCGAFQQLTKVNSKH